MKEVSRHKESYRFLKGEVFKGGYNPRFPNTPHYSLRLAKLL